MIFYSRSLYATLLLGVLSAPAAAEWGKYPEQEGQSEYRYREHPAEPNTQVAPGSSWYQKEQSPYSFREGGGTRASRAGDSERNRTHPEMERFRYDPSTGRLIPRESEQGYSSAYAYPGDRRGGQGNTPPGYTAPPPSSYRFRELPERNRETRSGELRYRPDQKLDEIPYMPGHGLPNWFDSSGAPPVFRPRDEDRRRNTSAGSTAPEYPYPQEDSEYLRPGVGPDYSYPAAEPGYPGPAAESDYSYPTIAPGADEAWIYRSY